MTFESRAFAFIKSKTEPPNYRQIARGVGVSLEHAKKLAKSLEDQGLVVGEPKNSKRLRRFRAVGER